MLDFFGCVACVVGWVKLWCGLMLTTVCVDSESTLMGFRYRLLSDIVCNRFGATCLVLTCCSPFLSVSTGPGCAWKVGFLEL